MDAAEIVSELRPRLSGALIATDFDGTLAPIVTDPQTSRPVEGALEALEALARCGARLAVITGRDAATALRLGGFAQVPGLVVEGVYGAQTWRDGELTAVAEPAVLDELRARLPGMVVQHAGDPAVWIEDKRLSLVVHTRRTADPEATLGRLVGPVAALADDLGLEVHRGRAVLELRLPGYDKGGALRRLVARLSPTAVLFAGDDLGDLPAFTAIRDFRVAGTPAWSVAAASVEVPELAAAADVSVDGPAGVVGLFRALA